MSSEPAAISVYVDQLICQRQGYPLWDPDPQDEPAVEIADVGYVKNGAFVRLFNASRQPEDYYNKRGIPANFEPLEVGEVQKRTSLPATVPIHSERVFQLGADVSVSAGIFAPAGGVFNFECSRRQGAVLILGDDAERRDALCQLPFFQYIRRHHGSWLAFANEVRGRGIMLNDLVLVTGCDKTSAWACASFSGQSDHAAVSFQVGQAGVAQVDVSIWGTWKRSSSATTHSGPRRTLPSSPVNDSLIRMQCGGGVDVLREPINSPPDILPTSLTRNQCVFLRGYKMCDRSALAKIFLRKNRLASAVVDFPDYSGKKAMAMMQPIIQPDPQNIIGQSNPRPARDPSRRHVCHECGERFDRPSSLQTHSRTHTGERPFICSHPGCSKLFSASSNMRRHERTHAAASSITDIENGTEGHFSRRNYGGSIEERPSQSRSSPITQPDPQKIFGQNNPRGTLDLSKRYVCHKCDERFDGLTGLETHMRLHTNMRLDTSEGPFECSRPGCSKQFQSQGNLRRHERTHDVVSAFEGDLGNNMNIHGNTLQNTSGVSQGFSHTPGLYGVTKQKRSFEGTIYESRPAVELQATSESSSFPFENNSNLDILLAYILESTTAAKIAAVHDDDLIALLEGIHFEAVEDFNAWIHKIQPRVFLEGEVGMLETTYRLWISGLTSEEDSEALTNNNLNMPENEQDH